MCLTAQELTRQLHGADASKNVRAAAATQKNRSRSIAACREVLKPGQDATEHLARLVTGLGRKQNLTSSNSAAQVWHLFACKAATSVQVLVHDCKSRCSPRVETSGCMS